MDPDILYKSIKLLNNGFATNFFCVNRGVRQGDPLSPLLFILSLEILACFIRQDCNIHGLVINNEWRWRGLTLLGRIQIVKTFVIPKFMYKASLTSVSEDLIKDVNKLLYGFIWKGNDKIKRTSLINDIENGGLKMLDIQSMISSQRVIALKRFIEDYDSPWKSVLETFFRFI